MLQSEPNLQHYLAAVQSRIQWRPRSADPCRSLQQGTTSIVDIFGFWHFELIYSLTDDSSQTRRDPHNKIPAQDIGNEGPGFREESALQI